LIAGLPLTAEWQAGCSSHGPLNGEAYRARAEQEMRNNNAVNRKKMRLLTVKVEATPGSTSQINNIPKAELLIFTAEHTETAE